MTMRPTELLRAAILTKTSTEVEWLLNHPEVVTGIGYAGPTVLGAGIGGLVGGLRPEAVRRKGHGAGRAALTGAATGAGIHAGTILGSMAGGALGAPALGGLAGGTLGGIAGHQLARDPDVDSELTAEQLRQSKKRQED